MIRDSQRGFEFSRLHSLLSWAFSQQHKINGITNRSVTFKNMIVIRTLWTLNCWLCSFFFRKSHAEVFCKKSVLRNLARFTGKHLRQILFFNKVAGLRPVTLLKKKFWHSYFPVNFAKFLRTPFIIEQL